MRRRGHPGVSMLRMERNLQDSGFQSLRLPLHLEPSTRLMLAGTEPPMPQLPHCKRDAAEKIKKGKIFNVT